MTRSPGLSPARRVVAAPVFLALALVGSASAQSAAFRTGQPSDDSLVELAKRLYGQSRARIRLVSQTPDLVILQPRLVGRTLEFERYAPGAWTLDTTPGQHRIVFAEIARLQIRGSAWDKGALVGLLVGAAAIEAVNAAGKYQIDRGETLFIAGLFGAGGAMAGTLIGAPFQTWRTVYAAP